MSARQSPPFGLRLVAEHALELRAEKGRAAVRGDDPWAELPWRVMTNMLAVPARELRDPVPFFIRVVSNDSLFHARSR
jgi:hypothetical protein